MKKIVDAETDAVEENQVAYLDGYHIADRLLEGVMFEIHIVQDQFVCNGVAEGDIDYYDDFAHKKHVEWQTEIVDDLSKMADSRFMDSLTTLDGTRDLYVIDDGVSLLGQFDDIVGMTVEEALPVVKDRGIEAIRASVVDGRPTFGTMDYRLDRLNVSVEDGKIVGISKVG